MPTPGNAAARTALPQPPNVNQNVPKNSADHFALLLAIRTFFDKRCIDVRQATLKPAGLVARATMMIAAALSFN
jgi:hypothetical protein